ncbi:MAG: DUF4279 domain-containing protein [Mucilaginibacter sp.]
MSCVLSIIGEDLNVDAFVSKTKMKWDSVWYKGDVINRVNPKKKKHSGVSIATSEADFDDVKTQITETIDFLIKRKENLIHIATTPGIQYVTINFGVDSVIDEDHLTQGFFFPPELIKICSELGIGIELSIYKPDMQVILETRRTTLK